MVKARWGIAVVTVSAVLTTRQVRGQVSTLPDSGLTECGIDPEGRQYSVGGLPSKVSALLQSDYVRNRGVTKAHGGELTAEVQTRTPDPSLRQDRSQARGQSGALQNNSGMPHIESGSSAGSTADSWRDVHRARQEHKPRDDRPPEVRQAQAETHAPVLDKPSAAPLKLGRPAVQGEAVVQKFPADILAGDPPFVPRTSGVRMTALPAEALLMHSASLASAAQSQAAKELFHPIAAAQSEHEAVGVAALAVQDDTVDLDCEPGNRCVNSSLAQLSPYRGLCVNPGKGNIQGQRMCWDICNLAHEPDEYFEGIPSERSSFPKVEAISALIQLRQGLFSEQVTCPKSLDTDRQARASMLVNVSGDSTAQPAANVSAKPTSEILSKSSQMSTLSRERAVVQARTSSGSSNLQSETSMVVRDNRTGSAISVGTDSPDPRCTVGGPCTVGQLPRLRGVCVQPPHTTSLVAQQCWDVCNISHSPEAYFMGHPSEKAMIEGIRNVRKGMFKKVLCPYDAESFVDEHAQKVESQASLHERREMAQMWEAAAADHKEASAWAAHAARAEEALAHAMRSGTAVAADAARGEERERRDEKAKALKALARYREELAEIKKAEFNKALAEAEKAEVELKQLKQMEAERDGPGSSSQPAAQIPAPMAQLPAASPAQASWPVLKKDVLVAVQGQSSVHQRGGLEAQMENAAEEAERQEMEALSEAEKQAEETEHFVQQEESEIKEDLFNNVVGQYNKKRQRLEKDLFEHVVGLFDKERHGLEDEDSINGGELVSHVRKNGHTRVAHTRKARIGHAVTDASRPISESWQSRMPSLSLLQNWLR